MYYSIAATIITVTGLSATAGAVTYINTAPTYTPVSTVYYSGVRMNAVPVTINGYRLTSTRNVNNNIAQATFACGGMNVTVRKAVGSTGISTSYPGTYRTSIRGRAVEFKGTRQGYYTATWRNGQYNYVVKSSHPFDMAQMTGFVAAMMNA
ncbi:MAG: hypothetical protein IKR73_03045 [Oscillospiraceae bacterium]|nr:hypothetical protein [Oscillospiraceae bacterium]